MGRVPYEEYGFVTLRAVDVGMRNCGIPRQRQQLRKSGLIHEISHHATLMRNARAIMTRYLETNITQGKGSLKLL
jgi:hypothetical protein